MTADEWVAAVLAEAPPLTAAQARRVSDVLFLPAAGVPQTEAVA